MTTEITNNESIFEGTDGMPQIDNQNVDVKTPFLPKILGPEWSRVRWQRHAGETMFFACDVKDILGLSNVTTATRGVTGGNRVSWDQRVKAQAYDPNIPFRVILLTLAGVFQLVLNNNSKKCGEYKNYIATQYLPTKKKLVLFETSRSGF